ncbi:MAG: PilZ domain-containing protein [Acidobacteriota bacterium]
MSGTKDKRRHPRVVQRLRVRSHDKDELELETIDLSVGGFSCTSPVLLAPMTKVALSLILPQTRSEPTQRERVVTGEAVVVRAEPSAGASTNGGPYRLALFFSRMEEEHRQLLQEFLQTRNGGNGRADH